MSRTDELIAEIGERLEELKGLLADSEKGEGPAAATSGPAVAPAGEGAPAVSSLTENKLLRAAGVKAVKGG